MTAKQQGGHIVVHLASPPIKLTMKNSDDVLMAAGETFEYARQYVKQQGDYIRLEAAERISKTMSAMMTALVLGIFSMLVIIMLSLAIAFWLGSKLGSYAEAFVIVSAVYCLIGSLIFIFRKQLVTEPTLQLVLDAFFEKENEKARGKYNATTAIKKEVEHPLEMEA